MRIDTGFNSTPSKTTADTGSMSPTECPHCNQTFTTTGDAREHAWSRHSACHYCGETVSGESQTALFKHWLVAHPTKLSQVDYERANASVDALSITDRLEHGGLRTAIRAIPRRYLLITAGATAASGIAIGGATLTSAPDQVRSASGSDGDYTYPVIGSDTAPTTITYFGNYKCPYCAQFSTGLLPDLREDYVVGGDLAIQYRHLSYINGRPFLGPDAVTAGHADLAVYNNAPDSYWQFHHTVYSNQGPESRRWATADRLTELANTAGITETESIRTAIEHSRYTKALRTTDQAAQRMGVTGTPMLVIQGRALNPSSNPKQTRQVIETAIDSD
jgi:protein-disulfide isomerase